MRAHKFSLAWLGEKMADLSEKRSTYIGSEKIRRHAPEELPERIGAVVERLAEQDSNKAKVLGQYYWDMDRVIAEMKRVLKPGRAAIVVIGTSTMRGMDVETHLGLAELAQRQGFQVVGIKERKLDRDRRMMPARQVLKLTAIENRMHQEYILALLKD
jgi:DNA modification methylase